MSDDFELEHNGHNGNGHNGNGNGNGAAIAPRPKGHIAESVPDVLEFRDDLVKKHFDGAGGLVKKLKDKGKDDAESLLIALIDEIVGETDNLLGNELVEGLNGDMRASSVISYKRTEALEKAVKAVQAKLAFEKESGVDLDSPSMMVIFRFFMAKVASVFEKTGVQTEQADIFFKAIGEDMEDWKKELREQFEQIKN